jgi:DNA repair protein RadA
MAVMAQQPVENGGQAGSVFYIDTEATFRPNRIEEIAKARKLNPEETLKNIYLIDAAVSSKLIMDINSLAYTIKDFNLKNPKKKVKLVIVDSLIAPFRADYLGRGELAPRQQAMGHCLQLLQRLAKESDLAVVFTNQVLARPDAMYGDPTIPAGGHVVAHKAQYRLFLRKGQQNKRVVRIIDAPDLEEAEELITITEKGIE